MTSSSDFVPTFDGATTTLPPSIDFDGALPELTTPQERFDHGYKRGYMAGYAEGARQAQAERAADLAAHKSACASAQSRAASLLALLANAAQDYLKAYGPREAEVTAEVVEAAFGLAEAVVGYELRTRPQRAVEIARRVLATLPIGPAIVRAHPEDTDFFEGAAQSLGNAAQKVTVVADAAVGPGGVVVTSGATTVDARLTLALARAREVLLAGDEAAEEAGDGAGPGFAGVPATGSSRPPLDLSLKDLP
jgi:flagellar assembly protein FliH